MATLRCILLSYTGPYWATPHPKWATRHPKKYCPCASQVRWSLRQNLSYIYLVYLVLCVCHNYRRVQKTFREFAYIFVPRNGIPRCFLFGWRVRNGIPRFFVPQNSRNSAGNNHLFRLFRLQRNYFFCRKYPTLDVTQQQKPMAAILNLGLIVTKCFHRTHTFKKKWWGFF